MAFPPFLSISTPACDPNSWADVTSPCLASTGACRACVGTTEMTKATKSRKKLLAAGLGIRPRIAGGATNHKHAVRRLSTRGEPPVYWAVGLPKLPLSWNRSLFRHHPTPMDRLDRPCPRLHLSGHDRWIAGNGPYASAIMRQRFLALRLRPMSRRHGPFESLKVSPKCSGAMLRNDAAILKPSAPRS